MADPTTLDRKNAIEARLLGQGASLGTLDAYGSTIRDLEAATIAGLLRKAAESAEAYRANPVQKQYDLDDVDPAILRRIADQVGR